MFHHCHKQISYLTGSLDYRTNVIFCSITQCFVWNLTQKYKIHGFSVLKILTKLPSFWDWCIFFRAFLCLMHNFELVSNTAYLKSSFFTIALIQIYFFSSILCQEWRMFCLLKPGTLGSRIFVWFRLFHRKMCILNHRLYIVVKILREFVKVLF